MDVVPAIPAQVAQVFESYAPGPRQQLMVLRELIYKTAASVEGVGRLQETLKWREPAYLTPETKSGSTVRLGWKPVNPDQYCIYFNCQTRLVETFRDWFADELVFEGNRAIVLQVGDPAPTHVLERCFEAALTYHLRK